jgi:branched-chain amino acid transport system substrate-binding protein
MLGVAALAAGLIAGCGGKSGGSSSTSATSSGGSGGSGPIKLGYLNALTGAYAVAGKPELGGVNLAIKDINAAGGVCNRQLKLAATSDDQGAPNLSIAGLRKLSQQDDIKLVIGPGITPPALATAPVAESLKTFFMVQTAQRQPWQGRTYVFSDVTPQDVEGRLMFQYLSKKLGPGHHTVALVYANVPYAQVGFQQLKSLATKAGWKIVAQVAYNAEGLSFSSEASKVAGSKADGMLIWGAATPSDASVFKAIRAAGYKAPAVGDVAFSLPFIPSDAGAAASTIVSFSQLNVVNPDAATKKFLSGYKAATGQQATYLPAAAYDAVHIMSSAIKKAGCSTDPTKVSQAMIGLTYKGLNGTYTYTNAYKGGPPASSFKAITYDKSGQEVLAPKP